MLCAAQEERPVPFAPPMVGSDEEIFSLAAAVAFVFETHTGENTASGKKPHQGIFSENRTIAVGATWVKWSGTHQVSEWSRLETALGPTIYGYDGHGSVRELTNAAGSVTDTYDYDAFGNTVNQTGGTPNSYLFAGEQYDAALGVYYNRARYLNTTTGRFWGMDTYEGNEEDPLSLHKYLYADGNPANLADPSGRQIDDVAVAAAISVGLGASIGGGFGYFASGTAKGAAFGALGGAALGLAFFSGNPQLITQTLASGIAGVFLQIGVNYAWDNYYSVLNLPPPNTASNAESLVVAFGTGASSGLVGGYAAVKGLNSGAVASGVQGLVGSMLTSIGGGQSLKAGAINAVEAFVVGALAIQLYEVHVGGRALDEAAYSKVVVGALAVVLPPLGTAFLSIRAMYNFRGRSQIYQHEESLLRGHRGDLEALIVEAKEVASGTTGRNLRKIDLDFRAIALRTEQSLSFELTQWMILMERREHEVAP